MVQEDTFSLMVNQALTLPLRTGLHEDVAKNLLQLEFLERPWK